MATRKVATVFGGTGFIGRYLARRLARDGYVIRVATRDAESAAVLRPMGSVGQIAPLYAPITEEGMVARAIEGADVVVNLVGILAERRKGEFQRIHGEGAGRIARIAAAAGVSRLVQVSAIGADPASPSAYGKSKAAGEAAVRQAMPSATILRPSVVFGLEDQFFNRFGRMAELLPVMPVIAPATKLQPVFVGDVADAIMAGLHRDDTPGGLYELGGPRAYTMRELMEWILKVTHRHRPLFTVSSGLAGLQAAIGEMLPGKPLTRDQLAMLQRDNVVSPGAKTLADLGIEPAPIDLVVPAYLQQYQPGGGRKRDIEMEGREINGKVPDRT
jgi:uncharacterized protein YbjT (DUF2867 family)